MASTRSDRLPRRARVCQCGGLGGRRYVRPLTYAFCLRGHAAHPGKLRIDLDTRVGIVEGVGPLAHSRERSGAVAERRAARRARA